MIGFDARTAALSDDQLPNPALRQPGTALFDSRSRDVYGQSAPGTIVRVGGRSVQIVGRFGRDRNALEAALFLEKAIARAGSCRLCQPSQSSPRG